MDRPSSGHATYLETVAPLGDDRRSASLLSLCNRPALSDETRSASYITGCDTNLQSISCATLHSLAAVAIIFEITLVSISSIRQRVLMHEDQACRMLLCREQLIISDEPGLDEGVQNQVCTLTRIRKSSMRS